MTRPAPMPVRLLLLALLVMALSPIAGMTIAASAQTLSPSSSADSVRSGLFDAQGRLLDGDSGAAVAAVDAARTAAMPLFEAFAAGSPALDHLIAGFAEAEDAARQADQGRLAYARSTIWTAILAGAYDRTMAAIATGDTASARSWLLVREFRPSTKFDRPGADGTLALRDLEQGTIPADTALATVRADLLDTYQANFGVSIAAARDSLDLGLALRASEIAGLIAGYWELLAPSYETQFGAPGRESIDSSVDAVAGALRSGDGAALAQSIPALSESLNGFRAAPLTEKEQARRAGQLMLYLSLIPVEYGRGIKSGQVISDIELQEAQTFLAGAQAAFADLRMTLTTQNPDVTASVAAALSDLDVKINAALLHETVAPANDVKSLASSVSSQLDDMFPEEWTRPGGDADFDVIASLLDEMENAVAAKRYPQAESARLEAYAIFEAGPEKRLMAFSPALSQKVEAYFWQGTSDNRGLSSLIDENATGNEIRRTRVELDKVLASSQQTLGADRPSDGAIIVNAATIVFREGLEAVLILVSLMASMTGANARLKRPVVIGAIGALFASAALFVLARSLLMSLSRYGEKLEAVVSLVAIGVLLLVMNWFFHKVYWTRWIAGHHARKRAIIGGAAGQMAGLVLLGFSSVFREGGETALFLQALVLDAGTAVVLEGMALGLAGVAVVGTLVFALQKKLPHKKMLIVTGVMLAVVLVVMVGHTVHVMQVVGWAPITPLGTTQFPFWSGVWLGVFATWESLVAQAAALVFVIGSYFLAELQHDRALARIPRSQPLSTA